jgi:hypothetical protein
VDCLRRDAGADDAESDSIAHALSGGGAGV